MTLVFWVRHGENAANLSRTLSHRVFDGDLTEHGRRQARNLAALLASTEIGFSSVHCSPLRRARQTADILCERLGLRLDRVSDALREVNVGDLDGRNDREAWRIYEGVLAEWRHGNLDAHFPGGEDGHELVRRVAAGLADATESVMKGAALVVAHGANIRAALPALTGTPDPGVDLPVASAASIEVLLASAQPFRVVDWPRI